MTGDYMSFDEFTFRELERHFSRAEIVEIVSWSAWQYGGPRMLSSWRAEDYKQNGKVVLGALPVRMPYDRYAGESPGVPYRPTLTDESPASIISRAANSGSVPADWLTFLSSHTPVLKAWSSFWWAIFDDGVLPGRLKQLIRVRLSQVMDCPEWAPADSQKLLDSGIDQRARHALERCDPAVYSARELAALSYAEIMAYGSPLDEDTFAPVAPHFPSDAERVELGYTVAIQIGTVRVYRWLKRLGELERNTARAHAAPVARAVD
jgi:hypothetical protein